MSPPYSRLRNTGPPPAPAWPGGYNSSSRVPTPVYSRKASHLYWTGIPTFLPPCYPLCTPRAAALLDDAPEFARQCLEASGERGKWLARQHPDWSALLPDYDYAAAYRREEQPAVKVSLLTRWRRTDPTAAREALASEWPQQSPRNQEVLVQGLRTGLTFVDWPWLREALLPKRKGVRRAVTELLLLAREPSTLADFHRIARAVVSERGDFNRVLPKGELKELLASYGTTKAPDTLPQRLLRTLPPESWAEHTTVPLPTFWLSLKSLELRDAARAIITYGESQTVLEFARFMVLEQPAGFSTDTGTEIMRLLPTRDFDALYDELLTTTPNALQLRSLPRLLALSRTTPLVRAAEPSYRIAVDRRASCPAARLRPPARAGAAVEPGHSSGVR